MGASLMTGRDIVLHHYWRSPFSEKVRLAFGLKGLSWHSVLQPRLAPKPDLTPLTGGYRRIPVMQIGADIYCDTRCILDELERRHPRPSLYPAGSAGLADLVAGFADRFLFAEALGLVFALHGDRFPPELHADRARFMAGRFDGWDPEAMRAKLPSLRFHLAHHLTWLERLLGDGRPFLTGAVPGRAASASFPPLWTAHKTPAPPYCDPAPSPRLSGWMERVGAIGHGDRADLDPADALAMARDGEPADLPADLAGGPDAEGWLGRRVRVVPDDWGFDPVEGELAAVSHERIALRRRDPALGTVMVHFPHAGFVLRRL